MSIEKLRHSSSIAWIGASCLHISKVEISWQNQQSTHELKGICAQGFKSESCRTGGSDDGDRFTEFCQGCMFKLQQEDGGLLHLEQHLFFMVLATSSRQENLITDHLIVFPVSESCPRFNHSLQQYTFYICHCGSREALEPDTDMMWAHMESDVLACLKLTSKGSILYP